MDVFEKIRAQQPKDTSDAWMVGEQLSDIIRHDLAAQEIVSRDLDAPGMSLADCAKKIRAYADKQPRVKGCVCVNPAAAERIIREFYGIAELGRQAASDGVMLKLEDYF